MTRPGADHPARTAGQDRNIENGADASQPASVLREAILDAATGIVREEGWSAITMARLADRVGVSRQTVYNEVGSKSQMAEALVDRELAHFLALVGTGLRGTDLPTDLRTTVTTILRAAIENPLLRAVATSAQGAAQDLLPLVSTRSRPIITTAGDVVVSLIRERYPVVALGPEELATATDAIVRLVLSHATGPVEDPDAVADDLAWVGGRLLTTGP